MTQLQSKPTPETPATSPSLALDIEGMTCAACATRIENVVRRVPGVTAAGLAMLWMAALLTLWTGFDYLKAAVRTAIER